MTWQSFICLVIIIWIFVAWAIQMDEINELCTQTSQSNKTLKVLHLVYVRHNKVLSFYLYCMYILIVLHDIAVPFSDIDISFLVNIHQLKVINTNNCLVILPNFCLVEDSRETLKNVIFPLNYLFAYLFFLSRRLKTGENVVLKCSWNCF